MFERKMMCSLKLLFLLFGISYGFLIEKDFDEINSVKNFANRIKEFSVKATTNISPVCKEHLLDYAKGLLSKKKWAFQMFDATAKIPSGLAEGNIAWLGSFDGCLKIEEKLSVEKTITGKYCLGTIPIGTNTVQPAKQLLRNVEVAFGIHKLRETTEDERQTGIQLATCMPDACSNNDIQKIYGIFHLNMIVKEDFCQSKYTQPKLDGGGIAALSFFGVVLGIIIVSTAYEIIIIYLQKKPFHPLLIAFSVLSNGKKLIATSSGPNQISCLHGLRVISTMWVILGHRYTVQIVYPVQNTLYLLEWYGNRANRFILNATVSVDTFFLLAGLVISYMYMHAKGKFNIALYYIHRYLRLTPVLAIVILFQVTLVQHLGSGPLWPSIKPELVTNCENNWWRALLYIQNYGDLNMCISQTWYLCVDTQLFILSPILLLPLKRWPKITLSATGFLTICSMLSCFLSSWFLDINHGLGTQSKYMKYYYFPAWTRAAPWLMGIILGYFIYKLKQGKVVNIKKVIVLCLWAVSLAVLFTCVFTGKDVRAGENKLSSSFYVALVRPAWAAAVGWVIVACVTGYGGPVNWFLSLPVFQVVSKFTYSMYLIHFTILHMTTAQMRTPPIITNATEMYIFWGDFALTLAASVILTLAFESPIITIEKCIFGYTERTEKKLKPSTEDGKKSIDIA